MGKLLIKGGRSLYGSVRVSGSKNAALPILAATLLAEGESVIHGVPNLTDIDTIIAILASLGVKITRRQDAALVCNVKNEEMCTAPSELVHKMRASICVLGPLLAKRKKAQVAFPGGCIIGNRPIDLHLKGLRELNAKIATTSHFIDATATKLIGKKIFLGGIFGSTVLGTANIMMAATLAEGKTIIENAALEPEIENLAHFLNSMGAKIYGEGTSTITIEGVSCLKGTEFKIIPDRIEAGTLMIAAAITKGEITLHNIMEKHLKIVIEILKKIGIKIQINNNAITITGNNNYLPYNITTSPYPQFPTDLQAQFMTLFTLVEGNSTITEKIYPERFMHVLELKKLGAILCKKGASVHIKGVKSLYGNDVIASDLRASAALVLAGLVAEGQTIVSDIHHLKRGYEHLPEKLSRLGACIKIC